MIYWFTGQPGVGKTVLANKLKELLATEKRNWRKDVFHIDSTDVDDIDIAQKIAEYIHSKGCDVVVSMISPDRNKREFFKSKFENQIVEFFVHSKSKKELHKIESYQEPIENFFGVETTKDNPNQSFNKIIHYLKETERL